MVGTTGSRSNAKKPEAGIFLGIIGLVAAVLIPLLQANGVDVNWQISLGLYVAIIVLCDWSFLKHAVPHKSPWTRCSGAAVLTLVIGALAIYATSKQYHREHPKVTEHHEREGGEPTPMPPPNPEPLKPKQSPKETLNKSKPKLTPQQAPKATLPKTNDKTSPTISTGPCSNVQVGGSGNQSTNCTPENPNAPIVTYDFFGVLKVVEGGSMVIFKYSDQDERAAYDQLYDLMQREKWDDLAQLAEQEIKKAPQWPTAYMFAATGYQGMKDIKKACGFLDQAITVAGGNSQWSMLEDSYNQLQCRQIQK